MGPVEAERDLGDAARDYILQVAKDNKVRSIIKSKSMTTEEIHLNHALEADGHSVFESDLGVDDVYIFALPDMTLKGTLTGFREPLGDCSDNHGNV